MLIISFAKTVHELLAGKKTMTRRVWKERTFKQFTEAYKCDELIQAYDKNPRNGGKPIGFIKLTKLPYWQVLGTMPYEDLKREGGKWSVLDDFFDQFPCEQSDCVTVLEFEFYPTIKTYITP